MQNQSQIVIGNQKSIEEFISLEISSSFNGKSENNPDLLVVDGNESASISIKSIKKINQFAYNKPFEFEVKVILILECNKLTHQAQNSLLKILEEPPINTKIILTSTSELHLLDTIISRCKIEHLEKIDKTELTEINFNEFIEGGLIEKLQNIEKLSKISPTTKRLVTTKNFLNLLAKYTEKEEKNLKLRYNKLTSIDKTYRQLNQNVNFKLCLENMVIQSFS